MQNFNNKTFPRKLKMLRLEASKSQEILAAELGISRSCLANYETGKRQPDSDMVSKIAEFFGIDEDYLSESASAPLVSLQEQSIRRTDAASACTESGEEDVLDISDLPLHYQLCMLEYYDFFLEAHNKNTAPSHKSFLLR